MGHSREVELRLARHSGITVSDSRLSLAAGRHVLIVNRFDRTSDQRIGFASAHTMLEAADGEQRSRRSRP
jgi:serine/threonine-protein kinase HipA